MPSTGVSCGEEGTGDNAGGGRELKLEGFVGAVVGGGVYGDGRVGGVAVGDKDGYVFCDLR